MQHKHDAGYISSGVIFFLLFCLSAYFFYINVLKEPEPSVPELGAVENSGEQGTDQNSDTMQRQYTFKSENEYDARGKVSISTTNGVSTISISAALPTAFDVTEYVAYANGAVGEIRLGQVEKYSGVATYRLEYQTTQSPNVFKEIYIRVERGASEAVKVNGLDLPHTVLRADINTENYE